MASTWTWWGITSLILFFIMMIGFGSSLKFDKFENHLRKPKGIIIGFLSQYILMPFICWILSEIGNLSNHLSVALILVGCCPGGALSNMVCYLFRMDIELSVAMTTISSIAAIFMMPLNTIIYLKLINNITFIFDWWGMLASCLVVVFGTLFGLYIGKKYIEYTIITEKIGQISMILIIIGNFLNNFLSGTPLWSYKPLYIYLLILSPAIIGSFFGFIVSIIIKLQKPSCIAVSIETGLQNAVLAIAIITLTYSDKSLRDEASGIPLVYATFSTGWACIWAIIWYKCGWSDAKPGQTLCQAWKDYKIEREKIVHGTNKVDNQEIPNSQSKDLNSNNQNIEIETKLNKHERQYSNLSATDSGLGLELRYKQ